MKVIFFASIRDRVGQSEEVWSNIEGIETIQALIDALTARGEPWKSALENQRLLFAKNQELVSLDTPISASDEIAIMPPVTGG